MVNLGKNPHPPPFSGMICLASWVAGNLLLKSSMAISHQAQGIALSYF